MQGGHLSTLTPSNPTPDTLRRTNAICPTLQPGTQYNTPWFTLLGSCSHFRMFAQKSGFFIPDFKPSRCQECAICATWIRVSVPPCCKYKPSPPYKYTMHLPLLIDIHAVPKWAPSYTCIHKNARIYCLNNKPIYKAQMSYLQTNSIQCKHIHTTEDNYSNEQIFPRTPIFNLKIRKHSKFCLINSFAKSICKCQQIHLVRWEVRPWCGSKYFVRQQILLRRWEMHKTVYRCAAATLHLLM